MYLSVGFPHTKQWPSPLSDTSLVSHLVGYRIKVSVTAFMEGKRYAQRSHIHIVH